MNRNPLFTIAIANISIPPNNSDRIVDTLRLFIDLIDVVYLDDGICTSGALFLGCVGAKFYDTEVESTKDVFVWTLEILGPDYWQYINDSECRVAMGSSCYRNMDQTLRRLLELSNKEVDYRHAAEGYSLLHKRVIYRQDPEACLILGANVNLVGLDPTYSPHSETPFSLSMYRADTFLRLQRAFKSSGARLETIVDQALENRPVQYSRWTKETLIELFSKDLDLSRLPDNGQLICPSCSYRRALMVQPYWMRVLDVAMRRTRSQKIQDMVETMLSTALQAVATSRDDHSKGKSYLHLRIQNKDNAGSRIEDQHLVAHDDKSASVRPEDEAVNEASIYESITLEDEDICIFCWHKWRETGLKPPLDESDCMRCDKSLSSIASCGRGLYNELYCWSCSLKQEQADFATGRRQKRQPPMEIESDDSDEEDDYSPYLIHA